MHIQLKYNEGFVAFEKIGSHKCFLHDEDLWVKPRGSSNMAFNFTTCELESFQPTTQVEPKHIKVVQI